MYLPPESFEEARMYDGIGENMKSLKTAIVCAAGSIILNHSASALSVGDKVPDLPIASTSGQNINLLTDGGAWRVLYFYPKSFTPGCTKQACGLRDSQSAFTELGVVVYGVSTDNLEKQKEFKGKYNLPFDLLADNEKKLSEAFEVLGVIGFSKRVTFIINPDGEITDVIDSVDVGTHDQDVIARLKAHISK